MTVETWVTTMRRGHGGWRRIVDFQTRESFACHAKNFEFYPKSYRESLNDFIQENNMFKIFVLKDLPGSSVKSMNCNTLDGELRADLETILWPKQGILSLN